MGAGISLTNTSNPSFTNMLLESTSGSGVAGTGVHGFTFNYGKIDNSGTGHAAQTSNIAFNTQSAGTENNIDGAVTIVGNLLTNAYYHVVSIFNFAGTISDLNISNNTLTSSASTASSLGSAIQVVGSPRVSRALPKATSTATSSTIFQVRSASTSRAVMPTAPGRRVVLTARRGVPPTSSTLQTTIPTNPVMGQQ
jgi:hypothetical protein